MRRNGQVQKRKGENEGSLAFGGSSSLERELGVTTSRPFLYIPDNAFTFYKAVNMQYKAF